MPPRIQSRSGPRVGGEGSLRAHWSDVNRGVLIQRRCFEYDEELLFSALDSCNGSMGFPIALRSSSGWIGQDFLFFVIKKIPPRIQSRSGKRVGGEGSLRAGRSGVVWGESIQRRGLCMRMKKCIERLRLV